MPLNVTIVLPTGVDTLLLAAENITVNLRQRLVSNLELPSLYRRAYQIVNETAESGVVQQTGKDA